jgi:hypothetical protein
MYQMAVIDSKSISSHSIIYPNWFLLWKNIWQPWPEPLLGIIYRKSISDKGDEIWAIFKCS